ncbi:hypothetical protein BD769DRAFT_1630898 [Suillus cothurnatus]|nr:hypothetical protein BD769DRAFT_1630898 [Suillus cothurnatus]
MKYALTNMEDQSKEDFGSGWRSEPDPKMNPLAVAYPILFPYGIEKKIGFDEHVQWALQYYDHRFCIHHSFPFIAFSIAQKREALQSVRIQMQQQDFEKDAWAISSVTIADLKQVEKEEATHIPHIFTTSGCVKGSDKLRASYQGQIWGMTLKLCGPSLWITINPNDLHNPIAQIFIGEEIDMDKFLQLQDPYRAAKYFLFFIHAVLSTLFSIEVTKDHVCSSMGILRVISAYYGVVEAQGYTPNSDEMLKLMKTEEFQDRIQAYIKQNI